MRYLPRRRLKNALLLVCSLVAVGLWIAWLDRSLARSAHATGYVLYTLVLFLAAYNLRKKLPSLPLGSSSTWMQAHLWAGIGSGAIFWLHLTAQQPESWALSWPNGWMESWLAFLFLATFSSGLIGLYLTRTLPKQLARTGEQFVYERIPRLRAQVRNEARATVLESVHATGATTLADFYADRLHGFFARPRSLAYWWRPTSATRKRLFDELTAIDRLSTEGEHVAGEQLFKLVRRKDDLDFPRIATRVAETVGFCPCRAHLGIALVRGAARFACHCFSWRRGVTPPDDKKRPTPRANLYGDTPPTDYDRPNRSWICGLEEEGCPCSVGPTTTGRCPGAVECQPVRDGDRWLCNRSELRGGPCDGPDNGAEGPTPDGQCCLSRHCRPKRSLRAQRGRWITGAVILSLGVLLLTLGSLHRNELIVPGPLSSHHAQVIAHGTGSDRCATCHPGAKGDTLTLIDAGVRGSSAVQGVTQSALCLQCHQDLTTSGAKPLLAHGLSQGAWKSEPLIPLFQATRWPVPSATKNTTGPVIISRH